MAFHDSLRHRFIPGHIAPGGLQIQATARAQFQLYRRDGNRGGYSAFDGLNGSINTLLYQRQPNHSNKTKSTAAKAQADKVFSVPRRTPAEDFPTTIYREDQERVIEKRIQEQRRARLELDPNNHPAPTKQQRKQRRRSS